jgi:DNA polymerase (family 10)
MGTLLELKGENPFRCRAYHQAAQALASLPSDLSAMIADGSLSEVPGIGQTLFAKIAQLVTSGHLPAYDELRKSTPPGLMALLRVPGLGPKKIKALHETLGIRSLADLRAAAEGNQIAQIKGFGAKTQAQILSGIAFIEGTGERILLSTARELVEPVFTALKSMPGVLRAEICGSLRRCAETIGDLDLLFAAEDPQPVLAGFVNLPEIATILAHGATKASVRLAGGVQCDLRGVTPEQFPFALNYFTGSKAHNIALRRRAIAFGLKLSEYGLEGPDGSLPCADEAALYRALGLDYIVPELREDQGEIEAAETHALPKLIERDQIRGTFHCHTDWSDGAHSLEQMAEAARDLGLQYLGIADHSRSAAYAGGLSIERVHEQWRAINRLNQHWRGKFHLFKGIECDILADGQLDYPDEVLEGFDYVVASVHSHFTLDRATMTRRIIRAIEHPRVTMLGHATGRLLLARPGYEVDLDSILAAAAKSGTWMEINANPHRLDINAMTARAAKRLGIPIVINPDAHTTHGLLDLDYGVSVARRGWLEPTDVVNTLSLSRVNTRLSRAKHAH